MNNRHFTVCGLLLIDGRVLLVRHTYGTAEGRILLPGGYVPASKTREKYVLFQGKAGI